MSTIFTPTIMLCPECKTQYQFGTEHICKAHTEKYDATNVDKILDERGKRYGKFIDHATIAQELKETLSCYGKQRNLVLEPDQKEALSMICHKMARIINGDPDYADSWLDIAGYAQLVADRLEGKVR